MSFELYKKGRHMRPRDPSVTVTKQGLLNINTTCMERWLKDAEYVQLLFDADKRLAAIKPAGKDDEHVSKLRRMKSGNGGQVSASSFLRHHQVDLSATHNHPAEWNDQIPAVVFGVDPK